MSSPPAVVSGTRLAALRMFRGRTQTDLARALGKSQATVARYETDGLNGGVVLDALARELDADPSFFLGGDVAVPDSGAVSFRKRRSATLRERSRARAAVALASGVLAPAVRKTLRLPPVDLPDLSDESPIGAARLLREHWGMGVGPIRNVLHLLEAKGVAVYSLCGTSKALDALCAWQEGVPYILLSTAKLDGARARFDAAHELGHLVLHQGRDHGDEDRPEFEDQANAFASEFLAPLASFPRECPRRFDLDAFALLRGRWGLSIQALVRRGRDCGCLTEWQYGDAYRRMASMGWRSGPEPGCPAREESFVHARLFDVLGDRGQGVPDLLVRTGLRQEVFAELMPEAAKHLTPTRVESLFDERAPLGLE